MDRKNHSKSQKWRRKNFIIIKINSRMHSPGSKIKEIKPSILKYSSSSLKPTSPNNMEPVSETTSKIPMVRRSQHNGWRRKLA